MSAPSLRAVTMITGSCVWERCDAQPAEHLEAAHSGHLDVEQNEVVRLPIDLGERFGTVGGDRDEIALLTEPPGEDVSIVVVVVDDEQRALSCHWTVDLWPAAT